MLLGFMKSKMTTAETDPIEKIGKMLEGTWDLTTEYAVGTGRPESFGIRVFNALFKRLHGTVTDILRRVVALAALAPDLLAFSTQFKEKAADQAAKVTDISGAGERISKGIEDISLNTARLSTEFGTIKDDVENALDQGNKSMAGFSDIKEQVGILVETIKVLRENSADIGSISNTINAISDETNILSLNARIEAARGQTDGKGFKVIAEEVGHLAKQSKEATMDIRVRLDLLGNKIAQTVTAVSQVEAQVNACEQQIRDANTALGHVCSQFTGLSENIGEINEATERQAGDVQAVALNIQDIEASVRTQSEDAETISSFSEKVGAACDKMILDAGVFHLSGHKRARDAAIKMSQDPDLISGTKEKKEDVLTAYLKQFPFIELAYITDLKGQQTINNIYSAAIGNWGDLEKGYGSDWSQKEWFTAPARSMDNFTSKVYRSSATRQFCFTVSVPLKGKGDRFAGVLGVDVNFKDMLDI